jgi:hypothetical protein
MGNDWVLGPCSSTSWAIQDAGAAGSRDRTAATSIECAASASALEAEADGADRLLFVWLYRLFPSVLNAVTIVQPETVIRWHRTGLRLYWRWKSRSRGGRPRIPGEIRRLTREMSLANRLWGAPRIHRELLKLGIEVAQSTVAKYMARSGRGRSPTWKTFLHNHTASIGAMDFLIVPTVGFRLLFVLVILRGFYWRKKDPVLAGFCRSTQKLNLSWNKRTGRAVGYVTGKCAIRASSNVICQFC